MAEIAAGILEKKITGNRERDSRAVTRLVELGWNVETVWECELRGHSPDHKADIIMALGKRIRNGDSSDGTDNA